MAEPTILETNASGEPRLAKRRSSAIPAEALRRDRRRPFSVLGRPLTSLLHRRPERPLARRTAPHRASKQEPRRRACGLRPTRSWLPRPRADRARQGIETGRRRHSSARLLWQAPGAARAHWSPRSIRLWVLVNDSSWKVKKALQTFSTACWQWNRQSRRNGGFGVSAKAAISKSSRDRAIHSRVSWIRAITTGS